jgi:outer membrane protein TolC
MPLFQDVPNQPKATVQHPPELRHSSAAHHALLKTRLNVDLARRLEEAENEKIRQGAADLLALQIREQATFDAQVLEVDALNEYFRTQANYRAATAIDAPKQFPTPKR